MNTKSMAQLIMVCAAWLLLSVGAIINENKILESDLLKRYDKRHRPVKKESTTMNIQVFLMINHIERVDEKEQTMLLHGVLWAMWTDEYLTWNPRNYNNTMLISIESWKLWQPTFALYNSARSNGWFVYTNGMPATINNQGNVIGTGTFSFYVTCLFDFSDYPFDVQKCPIVLADWMYDLSKVNLSESVTNPGLLKPMLRLSYDLIEEKPKNHVAGWEMLDTWQKHCYWGPKGCMDETTFLVALDNYWSLLEFGIKIRRHAPYYGLTMVLPLVITASVTLLSFWIEDLALAAMLCTLNLLLQVFNGANLVGQLPPGNGTVPKIAKIYAYNLALTALAYLVHALIQHTINVLPYDAKLPIQIRELSKNLKSLRFFKWKGLRVNSNILSFAPLDLGGAAEESADGLLIAEQHHNPFALRQIEPKAIAGDSGGGGGQLIIDMEPPTTENERCAGTSGSASSGGEMVELDLTDEKDRIRDETNQLALGLADSEDRSRLLITHAVGNARAKWLVKLKCAVKSSQPTASSIISLDPRSLGGESSFSSVSSLDSKHGEQQRTTDYGSGDDSNNGTSARDGIFNALFADEQFTNGEIGNDNRNRNGNGNGNENDSEISAEKIDKINKSEENSNVNPSNPITNDCSQRKNIWTTTATVTDACGVLTRLLLDDLHDDVHDTALCGLHNELFLLRRFIFVIFFAFYIIVTPFMVF